MTGVTIGVIVLVVVVGLGLALVGMYNGLIKLRNLVQEAWAQIDVELKRRHDLIGNLVETVKGYAAHESGTLEAVTSARARAMAPGQGPAEAATSEAALSQALVNLQSVTEAYPDLKANTNFMALQTELSSTEDRIASARRYYNANVRELNTKVESIPTSFLAGPAGVTKAEYFETQGGDREAPQVSFGTGGPSGTTTGTSGQLPPAGTPAAVPPAAAGTPQDAVYPPASPQATQPPQQA